MKKIFIYIINKMEKYTGFYESNITNKYEDDNNKILLKYYYNNTTPNERISNFYKTIKEHINESKIYPIEEFKFDFFINEIKKIKIDDYNYEGIDEKYVDIINESLILTNYNLFGEINSLTPEYYNYFKEDYDINNDDIEFLIDFKSEFIINKLLELISYYGNQSPLCSDSNIGYQKYCFNEKLVNDFLNLSTKYYNREISEALRYVIMNTKYVNFYEFSLSIILTFLRFNLKNKFDNLILLYLTNEDKSNFYVLELFLHLIDKLELLYFKNKIKDILATFEDFNYVYNKEKDNIFEKNKIVVFDDCLYTGLQFYEYMKNNLNLELDFHLKIRDNINLLTCYMSKLSYDTYNGVELDTILLTKFYEKFDKVQLYCKNINVGFLIENYIYDKNYKKYINNLLIYLKSISKAYSNYNIYLSKINEFLYTYTPIYFDHKIADIVSTYISIYRYGMLLNNENEIEINSIIEDCKGRESKECPPKIYKDRKLYIEFNKIYKDLEKKIRESSTLENKKMTINEIINKYTELYEYKEKLEDNEVGESSGIKYLDENEIEEADVYDNIYLNLREYIDDYKFSEYPDEDEFLKNDIVLLYINLLKYNNIDEYEDLDFKNFITFYRQLDNEYNIEQIDQLFKNYKQIEYNLEEEPVIEIDKKEPRIFTLDEMNEMFRESEYLRKELIDRERKEINKYRYRTDEIDDLVEVGFERPLKKPRIFTLDEMEEIFRGSD